MNAKEFIKKYYPTVQFNDKYDTITLNIGELSSLLEEHQERFTLSREEIVKKICDWLVIPYEEKAIADHSVEELADALMGYIPKLSNKTRGL